MSDIDRLRADIDRVDFRILELLTERADIAVRIGREKRKTGVPAHDPVREAELMQRLDEFAVGRFDRSAVRRIYAEIARLMLLLQQTTPAVVAEMLTRTIPSFAEATDAMFEIGCRFACPATAIVDLGGARPEVLRRLAEHFGSRNRYVVVDAPWTAEPAAPTPPRPVIDGTSIETLALDLRKEYPTAPASVTFCVFALQFTPMECRQRILHDAFHRTVSGGVLILVERALASSAELGAMMAAEHRDRMVAAGYPPTEVVRKQHMLEGLLVPATVEWNEEMLLDAGFAEVDCFWRWMNFVGWIARKR